MGDCIAHAVGFPCLQMFALAKSAFDGLSLHLRGSQMILKQESGEMHDLFVSLLSRSLFKQYLFTLICHATSRAHPIISAFLRIISSADMCRKSEFL